MIDRFTKTYLECIGCLKSTKKVIKENSNRLLKRKKRLITEKADKEAYNLVLLIPDFRWDDGEDDEEKLNKTAKNQPWFKKLAKYGAEIAGEGHDSGEMSGQNAGDFCYDVVINGITKDRLQKLMKEEFEIDAAGSKNSLLYFMTMGCLDDGEIEEYIKTADGVVTALTIAHDQGCIPEFDKDDSSINECGDVDECGDACEDDEEIDECGDACEDDDQVDEQDDDDVDNAGKPWAYLYFNVENLDCFDEYDSYEEYEEAMIDFNQNVLEAVEAAYVGEGGNYGGTVYRFVAALYEPNDLRKFIKTKGGELLGGMTLGEHCDISPKALRASDEKIFDVVAAGNSDTLDMSQEYILTKELLDNDDHEDLFGGVGDFGGFADFLFTDKLFPEAEEYFGEGGSNNDDDDEGIDDEHTNLDAPNDPDDI